MDNLVCYCLECTEDAARRSVMITLPYFDASVAERVKSRAASYELRGRFERPKSLFFQMLTVIHHAQKLVEATPEDQEQAKADIQAALQALPQCHKKEPVGAKEITFRYRNYKGEEGQRRAIPGRIYWGATEWHSEPQWLFDAWDLDKDAHRTFALNDVLVWRED